VNLRFNCPGCERPARLVLPHPGSWQCPACDHRLQGLAAPEAGALTTCLVCGNHELYKQKDFPHWLGLSILAVACLGFMLGHWLYHPVLAWGVLLGSAAFDGLLYLWVRDVIVCYRCGIRYRGFPVQPGHRPFDLGTGERYRQERLRREQLRAEKQARGYT
jgi:hypothetical protein